MRTRLSWVLTVLGALIAIAGLAIMLILGPDSRFSTGPHKVDTDGIAVVTAPKVISWADVQIDVLAEVPVKKPIFIGLGNTVDVQNLVGKTARLEVTDFHTPWKVKTRQVEGIAGLPGAPTSLDWWLAQSAGRGGASISTNLPDETVSLAILSVGDTTLSGLQVTLAYGVKGGFAKGLGLLLLGSGAVLLARLLRRGEHIWADRDDDDDESGEEEVVYVFVDEDGVEHEISAEEAADYEVVEVEEVEDVVEEPTPVTKPPRTPKGKAKPEPEPEPETEPAYEDDEEIVYIFVDADGVEHQITEEEAEAYEFIDETVTETEDEPEPEPEPEQKSRRRPWSRDTKAKDEPAPVVEPMTKEEPVIEEPKAEPSAASPKVMYVFVDEDGVEHEVSEDELADFEVVDEEEEKP